MIRFYFHPTPNPAKVALFLEETGFAYELVPIDTGKGERHYRVLEERLAGRDHIVGGDYSIVDMSAWGWIDRAALVLRGSDDPLDAYRISNAGSRLSTRGLRRPGRARLAQTTTSRGRWTRRRGAPCSGPTLRPELDNGMSERQGSWP